MDACADQRENIVLYVYGELEADAFKALMNHLEICEGCRQEEQRLVQLLGKIEERTDVPELSPQDVQSLIKNIKTKLKNEREATWWHNVFNFRTSWFKPAFAMACVLLIAIAAIRYLNPKNGNEFQSSSHHQDVQLLVSDNELEILKNFELLKEMDTIQKLTNVVDPGDDIQPLEKLIYDRRGPRQNAYRNV